MTLRGGWWPDPFSRHQYRFYDSERVCWTEHVADGGIQDVDPPIHLSGESSSIDHEQVADDAFERYSKAVQVRVIEEIRRGHVRPGFEHQIVIAKEWSDQSQIAENEVLVADPSRTYGLALAAVRVSKTLQDAVANTTTAHSETAANIERWAPLLDALSGGAKYARRQANRLMLDAQPLASATATFGTSKDAVISKAVSFEMALELTEVPDFESALKRAKSILSEDGVPSFTIDSSANIDVGRELLIRSFAHESPGLLVIAAKNLFEAGAESDPPLSLDSQAAILRGLAAENTSPTGRFLLWSGIAWSLLSKHDEAIQRLTTAATMFESVAVDHPDWLQPALVLRGRCLHEGGEAALAAGDEARAVSLLTLAAEAYRSGGAVERSELVTTRGREPKGRLPSSGFFGERYGPPTVAVLGSSNSVALRELIELLM